LYASKDGGRNCVHSHDGDAVHPFGEPAAAEVPPQPPEPQPQAPSREEPSVGGDATIPQDAVEARTQFSEVLGHRFAEYRRGGTPPAALLVRVDNFDGILSANGRQVADVVLRASRQLLEAAVRDMDVVTEFDAATFAVVLPGAGLTGTVSVAERLRDAVASCSLPLGDGELQFSVSTGAAEAMEQDTLETLQSRAEAALAKAVSSGGNCGYLHDGERCKPAASMLQQTG